MVVNIDKFIDETEAGSLAGGFAVAPISWSPEVVQDISGPPTLSALPTSQISTHDHANAATSGLKFEFTVPENYDSGPIILEAVYAMSTGVAAPNNVIMLEVGAEIADAAGGGIDIATYAPASVGVNTPDNLTDVTRSNPLLTIIEGDFGVGDKIVFTVERLGSDGGDLHTGSWKLIDFIVVYDGQVAPNVAIHEVEVFSDTAGVPAIPGTKSSFDTLDFQQGFTHEQKFQFTIPDNWDGASDFHVRFVYAMTSAGGGNVRFDFSGDATSVNTGAVAALVSAVYIVPTFTNTDPHRTTVVYAIPGAGRTAGDTLAVTFNRPSADPLDTHVGHFQLISATISIGQGGSTAASEVVDECYLTLRDYLNVSGEPDVVMSQESADRTVDFEIWSLAESVVPAGRADFEWQGRLRPTQDTIKSIIIPIRGQSGGPTPQYQIFVYAEGMAGTPVYSGPLTAETTGLRSVVTITEGDLTAQPTGEKRYFVVVEATLDAGEELRVGTPFVRQE
jgi:hypothetical protein